jgi:hypothetical protein
LGADRAFARWGLVKGSLVIGGMPLKGVLDPHPSTHDVSSLFYHASSAVMYCIATGSTKQQSQVTMH